MEKGRRECVCQICGHIESVNESKLGHTWESNFTIDQFPQGNSDGIK